MLFQVTVVVVVLGLHFAFGVRLEEQPGPRVPFGARRCPAVIFGVLRCRVLAEAATANNTIAAMQAIMYMKAPKPHFAFCRWRFRER